MIGNKKIGIFDSGLGGLSVLSAIRGLLPNESYIYIGDSINAPYGTKSRDEVFELSKNMCDMLIEKGVKAIVIACNTATSASITRLREFYDVPIIGMEPAIKPALRASKGQVTVLATEMTLKEEKFQNLVESLDENYRIIKIPAPEWVDCVEEHLDDETYVKACVERFLSVNLPGAKNIVLGCTHYIFLKDYIRAYYHNNIEIFDGNIGTALQLQNTLKSQDLLIKDTVSSDCVKDSSRVNDWNTLENSQQLLNYENVEIINTKSEAYVTKSYELLAKLRKGI